MGLGEGGGQAGGSEIPSQASGSDPGHARGSVSSRDTLAITPHQPVSPTALGVIADMQLIR